MNLLPTELGQSCADPIAWNVLMAREAWPHLGEKCFIKIFSLSQDDGTFWIRHYILMGSRRL